MACFIQGSLRLQERRTNMAAIDKGTLHQHSERVAASLPMPRDKYVSSGAWKQRGEETTRCCEHNCRCQSDNQKGCMYASHPSCPHTKWCVSITQSKQGRLHHGRSQEGIHHVRSSTSICCVPASLTTSPRRTTATRTIDRTFTPTRKKKKRGPDAANKLCILSSHKTVRVDGTSRKGKGLHHSSSQAQEDSTTRHHQNGICFLCACISDDKSKRNDSSNNQRELHRDHSNQLRQEGGRVTRSCLESSNLRATNREETFLHIKKSTTTRKATSLQRRLQVCVRL